MVQPEVKSPGREHEEIFGEKEAEEGGKRERGGRERERHI